MKLRLLVYFTLCFLLFLITEISKKILHIEELFFNSLSEQLSSEQIENYLDLQDKWKWLPYIVLPLFLLIKTTVIASVLYTGTFFYSKVKITFKQLWDAVIKAEFVFTLVGVAKIIWFYFFQTSFTLEDLQYFYPLSALNIVGYQDLEAWFIYPLQVLNLFELAYWLLLAYFIGKLTQSTTEKGFKIVAVSYGSALLLWVCAIMFFTLSYS